METATEGRTGKCTWSHEFCAVWHACPRVCSCRLHVKACAGVCLWKAQVGWLYLPPLSPLLVPWGCRDPAGHHIRGSGGQRISTRASAGHSPWFSEMWGCSASRGAGTRGAGGHSEGWHTPMWTWTRTLGLGPELMKRLPPVPAADSWGVPVRGRPSSFFLPEGS